MFKISTAVWHTCLQSIAVVFHSVDNGFLRQGRPNQRKCICKLGNCFYLQLQLVIRLEHFSQAWYSSGLRLDELETIHYWRWSYSTLTWWNVKLKTLKMMGAPRKINAILLNIKINWPKLVNMCRYELTTCWQNFMEIYLTWVKISQKVLRGDTFFWLTLYMYNVAYPTMSI